MKRQRACGFVWLLTLAIPVTYEFLAIMLKRELLSMAAARYRIQHPFLVRAVAVVCIAVNAHAGGLITPCFDLFSERNVLHRIIARMWRGLPTPPWCRYFARLIEERSA